MEEYPSNSINKPAPQEKRVMGPVVTGGMSKKKKGAVEKFASNFIQEDVRDIKSYIFRDIMIPAFKKFLDDSVHAILYPGGGGRSNNRPNASRVSYRSYYDDDRRDSRPVRSSVRAFDLENYILDTRRDAEEVLMRMDEVLAHYHIVRVADYYDLIGVDDYSYTSNNYGWADLRDAKVIPVRGGFMVDLPKPMPID